MANTIVGRIAVLGQTVNVSKTGKEFLKRELVLDATRFDPYTGAPQQENFVSMVFHQKRCERLDGYKVGDFVEVSFILNGRKYEREGQTRYITDIVGYDIERKQDPASAGAQSPAAVAPQPAAPAPAPVPSTAPAPSAAPATAQAAPAAAPSHESAELPF